MHVWDMSLQEINQKGTYSEDPETSPSKLVERKENKQLS